MSGERKDELVAIIEARSTAIKRATRERNDALAEWAALVSPWAVGETTTGRGYSFTGKAVRVTELQGHQHYDGMPRVRVIASVLRNDGSAGKFVTEWYWSPGQPS